MGEKVKLNLEITIPKRWVKKFMQMLDCMRWCANVGASRAVAFYADGDGDFRPFDFTMNNMVVPTTEDWEKHDRNWNPDSAQGNGDTPQEFPPEYKTSRRIDFFFDAG